MVGSGQRLETNLTLYMDLSRLSEVSDSFKVRTESYNRDDTNGPGNYNDCDGETVHLVALYVS